MLSDILKQFNWLDYTVIFVLLRILYVSAKNGFVVELFKLAGIVIAMYAAMHYYTLLGDYVNVKFSLENVFPLEFLDFLVFVGLVFVCYALFALLRGIVCNFIKLEAVPALSKWGGAVLGVLRGVVTVGVAVFMLFISTIPYFNGSVKQSYCGEKIFNITVAAYTGIWEGLMSKLMTKEKFNQTISETQEGFNK